ncbi:hypothetical protein AYK26_02720 [Euryarchaeota archaeon SM23-78]|nr:MAG: hypothetical protein AYK26_02720 [Euryarchaeota archaeon SM23-78]
MSKSGSPLFYWHNYLKSRYECKVYKSFAKKIYAQKLCLCCINVLLGRFNNALIIKNPEPSSKKLINPS